MAFKYTGDASLGVSLSVEVPKPLDSRSVVSNLSELYSIPEKYAYLGMTVANVEDGNMYMLVDKAHISDKIGWKASYESIQIVACSEQEYQEWIKNTTPEYTPIDPSLTFIHPNTYYYIYEDSLNSDLFYLSAKWGKQIEKTLSLKANSDIVNALLGLVNADIKNLADNYTSSAELYKLFLLKSELDITNPSSLISTLLSSYYTKQKSDELFLTKTNASDIYVTKESLRGNAPSTGTDDFIFVTLKKYSDDKAAMAEKIVSKLISSQNVETSQVTIGTNVILTSQSGRLAANNKLIANSEEVPKIKILSQKEYDALLNPDPDIYYYTYGDKSLADTGYVSSEYLNERFYTKKDVDLLVGQATTSTLLMKVEGETLNIF